MNHKERLLRVLAGKPVDRHPFICPGGMMSMIVTEMMEEGCAWPQAHSDAALMAGLTVSAHLRAGSRMWGYRFA